MAYSEKEKKKKTLIDLVYASIYKFALIKEKVMQNTGTPFNRLVTFV